MLNESKERVMKKAQNYTLTLLLLLLLGITIQAQDAVSHDTSRAAGPAVTISVTERGVRFAALGSFGKMRLEVFNADGTSLDNSDSPPPACAIGCLIIRMGSTCLMALTCV